MGSDAVSGGAGLGEERLRRSVRRIVARPQWLRDELRQCEERLQQLRRNLAALELTAARHGIDVPLATSNSIEETREAIRELEDRIDCLRLGWSELAKTFERVELRG